MVARSVRGASEHVDLVHNQWTAGRQVRQASVGFDAGHLTVVGPLADEWKRRLSDVGWGNGFGDHRRHLEALSNYYQGDYLFATEPHCDDRCPFSSGDSVSMGAQPAQPAPAGSGGGGRLRRL